MASLPKTNPGPFMKAVLRERRFNKQKNHLRSWGHSSKKKHRRFAPGGFVEPGRWNEERRKARRLLPSEAPRFPPSRLSQFEKRVVTSFRRGVVNFVENPWSTKLKSVKQDQLGFGTDTMNRSLTGDDNLVFLRIHLRPLLTDDLAMHRYLARRNQHFRLAPGGDALLGEKVGESHDRSL